MDIVKIIAGDIEWLQEQERIQQQELGETILTIIWFLIAILLALVIYYLILKLCQKGHN